MINIILYVFFEQLLLSFGISLVEGNVYHHSGSFTNLEKNIYIPSDL